MSGLKGVVKGGWHPKGKGESGKESWRGDFKGVNTVAGWMGKGKDPHQEAAASHQSAPLSTLKDPDSFGPPPKRLDYTPGAPVAPRAPTAQRTVPPVPNRNDSTARERLQQRREIEAQEEEEANRPPAGPFRSNTTGFDTTNLPKPPAFRPGQPTPPPSASRAPPPRLPPRLPPRQNSHPDLHAPPPPPTYSESVQDAGPEQGVLNQGAMDRLGRAGVAIPGFGIGRASPPVPTRQNAPPPNLASPPPASPGATRGPQLSELQSRFAKMSTPSSETAPPSTGTSWAEKQAALKTASNIRDDPSKVSVSDMINAASTANNFRERHGEQAASGWRAANGLNQKYGITDRVNGGASPGLAPAPPVPTSPSLTSPTQSSFGKKAPPPPPKKKELTAAPVNPNEPPPIPLASKPKFN